MKKIINLKSFLLFFSTILLATLLTGCDNDDKKRSFDITTDAEATLTLAEYTLYMKVGTTHELGVEAKNSKGDQDGIIVASNSQIEVPVTYRGESVFKQSVMADSLTIHANSVGSFVLTVRSDSKVEKQVVVNVTDDRIIVALPYYSYLKINPDIQYFKDRFLTWTNEILQDAITIPVNYGNDNSLIYVQGYDYLNNPIENLEVTIDDGTVATVEDSGIPNYYRVNPLEIGQTTIKVTEGTTIHRSYTLVVNDGALPTLLAYTSPNSIYKVGEDIPEENINKPTFLGRIQFYDVSPKLPEGLAFDKKTGEVSGNPSVETGETVYTVIATNGNGYSLFKLNIATVTDVPNYLKYATERNIYNTGEEITPNSPVTICEVPHHQVYADVEYTIAPDLPAGLVIDAATGIISGTATEEVNDTTYTITATNIAGSTTADIRIATIGETPNFLAYTFTESVYTKDEAIISNSPLPICDQPYTEVYDITSYTITPELPAGLALDAATGIISGTPTEDSAAASYEITAANANGSAAITITIEVGTQPSGLAYTTPVLYTAGVEITSNAPTVISGVVEIYAITPELPDGLAFDTATGVISGTPAAETAAADYTVTATNKYGEATAIISIEVGVQPPSELTYASPVVYTVGVDVAPAEPTVTGDAVSYSVAPELPAGLVLDTATGIISGTPTVEAVAADYTITATNPYGEITAVISIEIGTQPAELSYTSPAVYTVGAEIAPDAPVVTGSVESYAISPELPEGLVFDTATGIISGTPTVEAEAADYTVTATNPYGSATAVVNITVEPEVVTPE